jgi:photosystem II stability/assembly factor-like uncharacterized protein
MLFISPEIGYLGGSYSGETLQSFSEYEAIIYKTVDGGNIWTRDYIIDGEVKQIEFIDEVLYVLVRIHTENSLRNMRSAIFRSIDYGTRWEKAYSTELPYYIRNIFPQSKSTIFALFAEQSNGHSKHYVARSDDAGASWEDIGPLENIQNYNYIIRQDQRLIFMGSEGSLEAYDLSEGNSYVIYDLKDMGHPIMTADSRNNVWLLGRENDGMGLLMIDSGGDTRKILLGNKIGSGNPYSFHIENDAISVFVTTEASILGVSKEFYHSDDGGKTWMKERIPFSLITKPTAYYGSNLVWAIAGGGDIQIRRPEGHSTISHNNRVQ